MILHTTIHSFRKEMQHFWSCFLLEKSVYQWIFCYKTYVRVSDPGASGKMDRLKLRFFSKRVYSILKDINLPQPSTVNMRHKPRFICWAVTLEITVKWVLICFRLSFVFQHCNNGDGEAVYQPIHLAVYCGTKPRESCQRSCLWCQRSRQV